MEAPIRLLSLLLNLSLALALCARAQTRQPQPAPAAKPADIVRQFYGWYVGELQQNRDPVKQDRAKVQKWVVQSYLIAIQRP